jgi:hypothetical protein
MSGVAMCCAGHFRAIRSPNFDEFFWLEGACCRSIYDGALHLASLVERPDRIGAQSKAPRFTVWKKAY